MTNQEAIKELRILHDVIQNIGFRPAIKKAIEALEKAEKYRLHNLRKHPDELPEHGRRIVYWYKVANEKGVYSNTGIYHDYALKNDEKFEYVGWKYLEKN